MNADDMLKYGHGTLMTSLDAVDKQMLELNGACGVWSVKNILAHLTSYEWVLVNALQQFHGRINTPVIDTMIEQGAAFNDLQVEERAFKSYEQQLTEYLAAHTRTTILLAEIPPGKRREKGLLAWYGEDYDLEDFIIYSIYAHKREHVGQIDVFKDGDINRETFQLSLIAS